MDDNFEGVRAQDRRHPLPDQLAALKGLADSVRRRVEALDLSMAEFESATEQLGAASEHITRTLAFIAGLGTDRDVRRERYHRAAAVLTPENFLPPELEEGEEPLVATILADTVVEVDGLRYPLSMGAVHFINAVMTGRQADGMAYSHFIAAGFPGEGSLFTHAKRHVREITTREGELLFRQAGKALQTTYSVMPRLTFVDERGSDRLLHGHELGKALHANLLYFGNAVDPENAPLVVGGDRRIVGAKGDMRLNDSEVFLLNCLLANNHPIGFKTITKLGFAPNYTNPSDQAKKINGTLTALNSKFHATTGAAKKSFFEVQTPFVDSEKRAQVKLLMPVAYVGEAVAQWPDAGEFAALVAQLDGR